MDFSHDLIFQVPKSAETINLKTPNDMAYVFSGAYTPMLCRLIEQVSLYLKSLLPTFFRKCYVIFVQF